MGTADELAIDVLINMLSNFSREYVCVQPSMVVCSVLAAKHYTAVATHFPMCLQPGTWASSTSLLAAKTKTGRCQKCSSPR